jgi:acetyl-CoA C-acetyltransferase
MSNVPRYLFAGRLGGQLYGDFALEDGLMGALLERDLGPRGELMGLMTERLVERWGLTREAQDEVAFRSHANATRAWDEGAFSDYVLPVEVPRRKQEPLLVSRDEGPRRVDMAYFSRARPYFKPEGGTVTSQNSSSINDAAAALILASEARARSLGLRPLARLRAWRNVGVERTYMGEGAFKVVPALLERARLGLGDIDFLELNEAFAAVLAAAFVFLPELPVEKVNAWGSGISLGHPVGCTGARQVVDMVHQLRRRGGRLGLTSRCVGGGIGSGEIVEVEP